MNERLPYEEQLNQQWNDLPLPDENMAWADMKRRLEEDDERRPLPFWFRGCAGWGLLAILLLGLGWWMIRPEKWFTHKKNKTTASIPQKNKTVINDPATVSLDTSVTIKRQKDSTSRSTGETNISKVHITDTAANKPVTSISTDQKEPLPVTTTPKTAIKKGTGKKTTNKTVSNKIKGQKTISDKPVQPKDADKDPAKPVADSKDKKANNVKKPTEPPVPSIAPVPITDSLTSIVKTIPKDDTVQKKLSDTITKEPKDTVTTTQEKRSKKDSSKNKSFSFSAGIALHQQLPVAGQSFTPYNSLGRKGSLRDYIPSVYIRLNRDDKWFIQSGFRYGAPQLVKKLLYSSKTDTISIQKYNTTSATLEKTFYHQVPLTFNYFVLPDWSLGAGVVWNKFSSAVSSRDIIQTDRFTGLDSAISIGTIFTSRQADTNFAKSYFHAIIETQYKWKRFSFGANYSFGLQPYIRFTVGGQLREEKNSSLQLFIRYKLWRSKKK